ncbi:MAG: hypothetical protein NZ922_05085 [Candidatus Methanomethyliaceae archaeon]|nr:hypothetical protein [Candidatus Methanomethyliaceae archaeon]MDW7970576.1 ferredoxin-thioredoxin reductase catalytic domain-containing protein [Nitrososphaerota archaeon]
MKTIEEIRLRAEADAKDRGYYLNPNKDFLLILLEGLRINEERYGYPSCPCRLASGNLELDLDIICPCDYRDLDIMEYGSCYCGLYVNRDIYEGKVPLRPIPERRPIEKRASMAGKEFNKTSEYSKEVILKMERKLWYCKQCGYVVFREEPPLVCPICKAKKEMFDEIHLRVIA